MARCHAIIEYKHFLRAANLRYARSYFVQMNLVTN